MATEQLTGKDRRTSERMADDSTLLVSGYSQQGLPFAVMTCINDISVSGISFVLNTSVSEGATFQLALCSKRIEGLIFAVRATVLRTFQAESHPGGYLIGARFDGEFVQIGNSPRTEDIARELEQAVEYDERNKSAEVSTTARCCDICGKRFVVPLEILQVSSPVCCFSCHQSHLKHQMPAEATVGEQLS